MSKILKNQRKVLLKKQRNIQQNRNVICSFNKKEDILKNTQKIPKIIKNLEITGVSNINLKLSEAIKIIQNKQNSIKFITKLNELENIPQIPYTIVIISKTTESGLNVGLFVSDLHKEYPAVVEMKIIQKYFNFIEVGTCFELVDVFLVYL